jgi:hypothetical protein
MKSLNTKISLASITFLLLIGTSLLGFSFVMPTAVGKKVDRVGFEPTTAADQQSLLRRTLFPITI